MSTNKFYKCSCCGVVDWWIFDDVRGDIIALDPHPVCDRCWAREQEEVSNA